MAWIKLRWTVSIHLIFIVDTVANSLWPLLLRTTSGQNQPLLKLLNNNTSKTNVAPWCYKWDWNLDGWMYGWDGWISGRDEVLILLVKLGQILVFLCWKYSFWPEGKSIYLGPFYDYWLYEEDIVIVQLFSSRGALEMIPSQGTQTSPWQILFWCHDLDSDTG